MKSRRSENPQPRRDTSIHHEETCIIQNSFVEASQDCISFLLTQLFENRIYKFKVCSNSHPPFINRLMNNFAILRNRFLIELEWDFKWRVD